MSNNDAVLHGAVALGSRQIQLPLTAVAAISQEVLAAIRQVVREEIERALASPPSAEAESRGKE